MANKYEIEKFKEEILKLHNGIPSYRFFGFIERLIPDKEMRDYFFRNGVFVKSEYKKDGQDTYFLGVNGMNLANSYIMEKLTSDIKKLTIIVTILTILVLEVTLFQILLLLIK